MNANGYMAKSKNKIAYILLLAVAVILLLIFSLYLYVSSVMSSLHITPPPKFTGPMYISAYVNTTDVFTYNNSQQLVGYSLVDYKTENAIYANFSMNLYTLNPLLKIYFLNSTGECYECLSQQNLYENLTSELDYYDLLTNSSGRIQIVGIQNLSSVPPGSMIIVATGLMPVQMMQSSNGTMLIEALLSKGDTILYVGDNFSRIVGQNGVIFVNSLQTLGQLYNDMLETTNFRQNNKYNPLNLSIPSPNFQFINGTTYGPLVYINKYNSFGYGNHPVPFAFNGTIVALPATPLSWSTPSSLALDIAKVINSQIWNPSIAFGFTNVSSISNGTIGIFTLNKTLTNSPIAVQQINSSYPLLSIELHNSCLLYTSPSPRD